MQEKMLNINANSIFYRINGEGRAVILIHGFGEDGRIWDEMVNSLEKNYRCIVPDLPGSGISEAWESKNISIADYAEAIHQIVEDEQLKDFCMIGHSMGGYVTLAYADAYPQRLTGIGLFHSTALADAEEKKESRKKAIAFIQENGPLKFLQTSIPGLFAPEHSNLQALKQLLDQASSFSGETLIQYYTAMMQRKDLTKVLVNSNIPVLLIAGIDDQAIPFEQSLKESSLAAETHFHVLRYTAHMGMMEEPEKAIDILANYLQFCKDVS